MTGTGSDRDEDNANHAGAPHDLRASLSRPQSGMHIIIRTMPASPRSYQQTSPQKSNPRIMERVNSTTPDSGLLDIVTTPSLGLRHSSASDARQL